MPKTLDVKSTLNLPRTAFPMKANLPQSEPRQLAEWEEKRLYQRHWSEQLEEQLSPRQFYRVNRQLLVNIESIKKIHTWLGGRLKLELDPVSQTDTVVSREKVSGFKDWIGR